MGRFDINFRDTSPVYDEKAKAAPATRDDFRDAGCSDELLAYMFPHDIMVTSLLAPEEWFWIDRGWFKRAPKQVVGEIYEIAGGCFSELPLDDQAALFEIEIIRLNEAPARGNGMFVSECGDQVTIESYALGRLLHAGGSGLVTENKIPQALSMLVNRQFEGIHGFWCGFDESRRNRYTPSPAYTLRAMEAFAATIEDIEGTYAERPEYFNRLFGSVTISDVVDYVGLLGSPLLERVFRHRIDHNLLSLGGLADLTLNQDGPRFREVKGRDRMGGGQALYLRNVSKPLELDYAIVQVSP